MAKSAWKFLKTNKFEIYKYSSEFKLLTKNQGKQTMGLHLKSLILNNINYMHKYVFHLGNCFISRKFLSFCVRSKGLEFLKFSKPFNFRSKKKNK